MCGGTIPGPHPPKDYASFLFPFEEECVRLAIGVPTYNCISKCIFDLHGYNLFGMGDIIAIEKMLNIKGHNSFCPCRSCKMKGARNVAGGGKIYYIPLTHPDRPDEPRRSWNPTNLPMRTHQDFIDVADRLPRLPVGQQNDLTFHEGIKGWPALRRVGSIDFARSFPWDIMHLFFENIIRILIRLWSAKFKGLDVGTEDYEIPTEIWDEIWRETAEAVQHIPAAFVRSMVNGPGNFTAEAWCFWFVYMAPILLKDRFKDPKYHVHLCDLTQIIKTCIAFTLTYGQINTLREMINTWLKTYERSVYSSRAGHRSKFYCQILLSVCRRTTLCLPTHCTRYDPCPRRYSLLWPKLVHLDVLDGAVLRLPQRSTSFKNESVV
ncbi:hypothetical protein B0H15DRAFT_792159 [Mycena belliarum]|uniref:Uncharacterized protein n=1 Tax=Mycena belliarum TaxID=1033014 RepID=A0AAD6XJA5_9AGAR|nr:hypothetical protein B0H15DRAFT_792159 [Mycena belliae]